MKLLFPITTILAIQLFWLLLTVFGFVITLSLQKLLKGGYMANWSKLPFAGKFVIATATSFCVFGLATVIGYVLRLPGLWLGVSSIVFSVCSVGLAVFYVRAELLSEFKGLVFSLASLRFFSPVGVLLIVIAIDYIISLYIGSYLTGDAPVHIAKMAHLFRDGFTLEDSYYGGVPEVRHHVNVMHTVYAIPLWFKAAAEQSWFLAIGYLKLLKVLAAYFLAWRLTEKYSSKLRTCIASAAAISTIAFFSSYTTAYPMDFVAVWTCLFIIGLLDLVSGKKQWLLLISCFLIALTHPLVSVAGIMLLGLCVVGLLVFSRKSITKYVLVNLVVCGLILVSTPVFTMTLPNQMSVTTQNAEIEQTPQIHISEYTLFKPNLRQITMLQTYPAIAIVSIVGLLSMIFISKKKPERIVVISLILIGPLVLNNPVAYEILRNSLPPWAIYRIGSINQLYLIYPVIGALTIITVIGRFKLISRLRSQPMQIGALTCLSLVAVITCNSFVRLRQDSDRNTSVYEHQKKTQQRMADIKGVLPADPKAIVMANDYESTIISSVSSLRILRMRDSRSTPAADVVNRGKCYTILEKDLDPGLLKQTDTKYVLVRKKSALATIANQKSYLKIVDQSPQRVIYKFNPAGIAASNNPDCEFRE